MNKPNYTQIPNAYIDGYMQKLSPAANMVFIAICRKTIGWHKETDYISLSQLQNLTGLTKNTVRKATHELEKIRLITTEKIHGRTTVYELKFNKTLTSEIEETAQQTEFKDSTVSNFDIVEDSTVSKFDPPLYQNLTPQKKIKEIRNKEKDMQPVVAFLTPFETIDKIFSAGSLKLTGQPYYRDGKEAKHIKLLEARYNSDPEAFVNLCRKYYSMIAELTDDFWQNQPFTPSAFNSLYNRIQTYIPSEKKILIRTQKDRNEWDVLLDEYGGYQDADLKYLLENRIITQQDYEYIIRSRAEVIQ